MTGKYTVDINLDDTKAKSKVIINYAFSYKWLNGSILDEDGKFTHPDKTAESSFKGVLINE